MPSWALSYTASLPAADSAALTISLKVRMPDNASSLPIAMFDSGMGGLTVFKALAERLPTEDLLYLGDTARLPYGTKGRDTIIRYSLLAARTLVERHIKMLVIACNTATAMALPTLRQELAPLPVLGVIEPGARAAAAATRNGEIAVIATEATVRSCVYQKAIEALRPDAHTRAKVCTLFVSMAEEGLMEGPLAEGIARHYLDGIFGAEAALPRPDTLLLGCTHFPLFKAALKNVLGPRVRVVDPASTVAETVERELNARNLLRTDGEAPVRHFMTTDNRERFARTGSLFLGGDLSPEEIELVDL